MGENDGGEPESDHRREERMAGEASREGSEELRLDGPNRENERERKGANDDGLCASFRGLRAQDPLEPSDLAKRIDGGAEHGLESSTRPLPDTERHERDAQVAARHPLGQSTEGLLEAEAELYLVARLDEFVRQGRVDEGAGLTERFPERGNRPKTPEEGVEEWHDLFVEPPRPTGFEHAEDPERSERGEPEEGTGEERRAGDEAKRGERTRENERGRNDPERNEDPEASEALANALALGSKTEESELSPREPHEEKSTQTERETRNGQHHSPPSRSVGSGPSRSMNDGRDPVAAKTSSAGS